MFSEERRAKILEQLNEQKRILVKDLAKEFNVSIDSIRRDLAMMEEKGLLRRTHGGAIPVERVRRMPATSDKRYTEGSPYEQAIATEAASYLKAHDTVFIGSAAIHYVLLPKLPEDLPLTVVTQSIKVAEYLSGHQRIETILVGGRVKSSGSMTDALTYEWMQRFTFDVAYLSGGGISAKGISTATPEVANLGKLIAKQSRKRIGLFPHYKMGVDAFIAGGSVDELDVLITDEETHEEQLKVFRELGVDVVVAKGGK